MAIVSISELLGYNKCPELDARFTNLLGSFLHKNEITETATHYVFSKDANTQISVPKNGGTSIALADNLTTNDTTKGLTASQGVVIKQLIDNITTILGSDDTALDALQELVNFIKQNKSTLDTLSIANISGLDTALALKTATGGYTGTSQDLKNEINAIVGIDVYKNTNYTLTDADHGNVIVFTGQNLTLNIPATGLRNNFRIGVVCEKINGVPNNTWSLTHTSGVSITLYVPNSTTFNQDEPVTISKKDNTQHYKIT